MTSSTTITKTDKIIFWSFTTLFVAFEGLLPALTFNSKMAVDAIHKLGFPDYFRIELTIGKILGAIFLILPMIPPRIKEWAYVGFGISLISACIADSIIYGAKEAIMPVVVFVVLIVSYLYYHKIYVAKS
jgi:hypothetical protein